MDTTLPVEAQQARFEAKEQLNRETVEDVGNLYFRACAKGRHHPKRKRAKRQATIKNERYFFDTVIVPKFGRAKLSELTKMQIQAFIDHLEDSRSIGTSQKCHVVLHAIYVYAEMQGVVDHNPCQTVVAAKHPERERVLTDFELKTIWGALTPPIDIDGATISANVATSILLAMVTLQRRGEIIGMHLSEIDQDKRHWTIPATRTKNHSPHIVPLSDWAFELLNGPTYP